MSSTYYIPPNGLRFRLLGYASQRVLFSRTHAEPQVFHHPLSEEYSDQYFTLVHGTGKHEGLFLIKSVATAKVLFSRTHLEPNVWHVDGDGQYEDNWFKLEPGEGKNAGMFRLINPASNTVVFSRTHADPQVWNYQPVSTKYGDHYFSFLYEDMEIVRVDYDLKAGKITNATPIVLATQLYTNNTAHEQDSIHFDLEETTTHTSTYEYGVGFTLTAGTTFKAGIPFVGEAEIELSASLTNEWKFGEANETSQTWKASFPAKAAPGETVRGVSTVTRGQLDVPYTITLRSKSNKVEVQTKGTWRGVSTWDLRHTVSTVDPK